MMLPMDWPLDHCSKFCQLVAQVPRLGRVRAVIPLPWISRFWQHRSISQLLGSLIPLAQSWQPRSILQLSVTLGQRAPRIAWCKIMTRRSTRLCKHSPGYKHLMLSAWIELPMQKSLKQVWSRWICANNLPIWLVLDVAWLLEIFTSWILTEKGQYLRCYSLGIYFLRRWFFYLGCGGDIILWNNARVIVVIQLISQLWSKHTVHYNI